METPTASDFIEQTVGNRKVLIRKFEVWLPSQMVALLQELLESGLYGRTLEETVERLVTAELQRRFERIVE